MNYSVGSLLKMFSIATALCSVNTGLLYAAGGTGIGGGDLGGGGGFINVGGGNSAYFGSGVSESQDNPDDIIITPVVSNVKTLCPAGQYVYKCGNYKIGFNWLKGLPEPESTDTEEGTTSVSTDNYYISNDQSELLDQMRVFFGGTESSIERCKTWSNNSCTERELTTDYLQDRTDILMSLCNPFNSNTAVTCAYCPNSANIEKSTVTIKINTTSGVSTAENWKFHTIADCYVKEFSDSTGTYIYINDSGSLDAVPDAEVCYYTNTNPEAFNMLQGDSIEGFASGTNTANEPVLIKIPTTDFSIKKAVSF